MYKNKNMLFVVVAVILIFSQSATATDNIDWIGDWNPSIFAELTDCEYIDDVLYVCGVSGFSIVDITNLESPYLIGRYTPPGHPYVRFYHIAVSNNIAYGFGREDGISVISFENALNPDRIDVYVSDNVSFEDGIIYEDLLYVTAHDQGIYIFDILGDGTLRLETIYNENLLNATAIKIKNDMAYIADGASGIAVLDISDPVNPVYISQFPTSSSAQDLDFYGDIMAVAVGGQGVDIIDYTSPYFPVFLSNITGEGSAFNISVENNLAYVARWDRIDVIDLSIPDSPVLAGWEDTPVRAMGLTVHDSTIFVADWAEIEIYNFGQSVQQDIHIDFSSIDIGFVSPPNSFDTTFMIYNTGGADLEITDISVNRQQFHITPSAATIPMDTGVEFSLQFTPVDNAYVNAVVSVFSDDPDELSKTFRIYANGSARLNIGDEAPNFTLEDTNGDFYTLSDYYGKVVLLAFFASW